jgi:hypothetical protein
VNWTYLEVCNVSFTSAANRARSALDRSLVRVVGGSTSYLAPLYLSIRAHHCPAPRVEGLRVTGAKKSAHKSCRTMVSLLMFVTLLVPCEINRGRMHARPVLVYGHERLTSVTTSHSKVRSTSTSLHTATLSRCTSSWNHKIIKTD